MGKKDKSTKKKSGDDDVKRDQKLQAILLADSFTTTFRPLTRDKPKVLLPLVNAPMLLYTIEFLAQNGVEEIFVFSVNLAEMIEAYIQNLKLSSNLSVVCIPSANCLSSGDALREIDAMGVIRSDPFILISGDVISNMDLKKAITFHTEKRKTDFSAVMTVVLKPIQRRSGLKPIYDDLIVALDKQSSQLILFDDNITKDKVNLPIELLRDHSDLVVRSDLLDCHIDICSPEVLLQFSDNFDYQNIRKHFIQNEVVNWEIGEHIYGYTLSQNEYAARVHDPRSYHSVSKDIIRRWVYPMVPDTHIIHGVNYEQRQGYLYREDNIKVASNAKIASGTVIGRGTVIEEGVVLERCVIGKNCVIRSGASIRDSYVWDGAVIGCKVSVTCSIVGEGCVLNEKSFISRGCIFSNGVVVGPNTIVPENSRISRHIYVDEESARVRKNKNDACEVPPYDAIVGTGGVGYKWTISDDDDFGWNHLVDNDPDNDEGNGRLSNINVPATATVDTENKFSMEMMCRSSSMGCTEMESWKLSKWATIAVPKCEDEDDSLSIDEDDEFDEFGESSKKDKEFLHIIAEMIITGRAEGHPAENILMEIKGFKFAQNKDFCDCIRGVLPAILTIIVQDGNRIKDASGDSLLTILRSMLGSNKWGSRILNTLIQDTTEENALLKCVEDQMLKHPDKDQLCIMFKDILSTLYDEDLLSDDTILEWAKERRSVASKYSDLFHDKQIQEFIESIESQNKQVFANDESDDDVDEDDDDDKSDSSSGSDSYHGAAYYEDDDDENGDDDDNSSADDSKDDNDDNDGDSQ